MQQADASSIGACDAKIHFSELLQRVAAGEKITITRHGTPIARLVPVQRAFSEQERCAAILAMRQVAARNRLGGLPVKALIADGRK